MRRSFSLGVPLAMFALLAAVPGPATAASPSQRVATTATPIVQATGAAASPRAASSERDVLLDQFYPAGRTVVHPGMKVRVSAALLNLSPLPRRVHVQLSLYCWDARFVRQEVRSRMYRVIVPGDRDPVSIEPYVAGLLPERIVHTSLTIPRSCVSQAPYDGLPFPFDGLYNIDIGKPAFGSAGNEFVFGFPFTSAYYKKNLTLQTHGSQPPHSQAHHTLPQKFERYFIAAGINIHDPEYLLWWCSKPGVPTNHQRHAAAYNRDWDNFTKTHRNPSAPGVKAKILQYRKKVVRRYEPYECP